MAIEITDSNINETLGKSKIMVLDFWAPWCGPCRMLGPIIEELAHDNADVTVGKLNVDENSVSATKYGVRGIPTIIFFKDGEIVDKIVGVKSKADFQLKIDNLKS